jgi:2-succinyl-6-hydroxy-2,4-cyclohexadiene-1-carboxylate synthase
VKSPPLVLLHGFTSSAESWNEVLARLPTREALCPPLLGHGISADAVRTFDDEVDRLVSLFGSEPVHLCGYSLGARLALGIVARYPERVRQATLVAVHPGLVTDAERDERRRSDAHWIEMLETCGIEAFVDAWGAQALFATQRSLPESFQRRRQKERLSHDPKGLARSLRVTGLAEMPNYRGRCREIGIPVTLLAGELDTKFSALAEELSALFPDARRSIVPRAGHDLLLERPDLVARQLS